MCLDGVAHTKEETSQWYGEAADKIWNEAQAMDHDDWQQTYFEATDASAAERMGTLLSHGSRDRRWRGR